MSALDKTETWRLDVLERLGVTHELAREAATDRRESGGFAVDVRYVESWLATHAGCTPDQAVRGV